MLVIDLPKTKEHRFIYIFTGIKQQLESNNSWTTFVKVPHFSMIYISKCLEKTLASELK